MEHTSKVKKKKEGKKKGKGKGKEKKKKKVNQPPTVSLDVAISAALAVDAAGSIPASEPDVKQLENKKQFDGKQSDDNTVNEVRIAVVGNVDSGKSTLIGVLTGGQNDDGRGLARKKVFMHQHEQGSGRTSSITTHIMGFDKNGDPVHQKVAQTAASQIKDRSYRKVAAESSKLVTFVDLAGHERYLKTTIAGLTGSFPDYACLIVNSLAGILKMTREHLGVVLALRIPCFVVVTKLDMCPENVLKQTQRQLNRVLKSPLVSKMPIWVKSEEDVQLCIDGQSERLCPIFSISSVTGLGLPFLTKYLSKMKPYREWSTDPKQIEFSVDHTFNVTGVGVVVSGTLSKGTVKSNQNLLLGPMPDGKFITVFVRSIHSNRVPVEECSAGHSCCLAIRAVKKREQLRRAQLRRGMVLISTHEQPCAYRGFVAEVLILHHATTIKPNYQAVIHCGIVRQTASIEKIDKEFLRTGDKASVHFRFVQRAEFLTAGTTFIFREGSTKGVGRVVTMYDPVTLYPQEDGTITPLTSVGSAKSGPA